MHMGNVENILSAFSQEIRLRIAILLSDSSLCVNCLTRVLNLPQSTISRHLALLRRGGVVRVKRDNTHCFYTLDREGPLGELKERLIFTYYETLKALEPFRADLERLETIKKECNSDCRVYLKSRTWIKNLNMGGDNEQKKM